MGKRIENEKDQPNLIWFFGISLLVFFGIFLLNCKTGYVSDDYAFHFIYEGLPDPSRKMMRVTSLLDIFKSVGNNYMVWGGRLVTHSISSLFLMVNKMVFNICNSVVVVLLGLLVYFHANYGKKRNLLLFSVSYFLIWFFIPDSAEDMMWQTCTINYMWACVFVLLFLIPYRIHFERERAIKHPVALAVLMIPAGLIAGCSNENDGGVAGLMALMFIIFFIKRKRALPLWSVTGIVSVAIGTAIILLAPGNIVRAKLDMSTGMLSKAVHLDLKYNVSNVIRQSFVLLWPLLLMLLIAVVILLIFPKTVYKKSKSKRHTLQNNSSNNSFILPVFYFACAVSSCAVLVLPPVFSIRSLFITAVFFVVSFESILLSIVDKITLNEKSLQVITLILVSFCSVSITVDAAIEYRICSYNYEIQMSLEEDARSQIKQGKKDIVLTGEYNIIKNGRFNIYNEKLGIPIGVFDYPALDGTYLEKSVNTMMAAYFGADTFTSEAHLNYIEFK